MFASTIVSAQQYIRDTTPSTYLKRLVLDSTINSNFNSINLRHVVEPTCPINITPTNTCPNYNFNENEFCHTNAMYPTTYMQDTSTSNNSYEVEDTTTEGENNTDPIPPIVKDVPLVKEETASVSTDVDEKQPAEQNDNPTKAHNVEMKNESCVNCCIIA